jgi:hypothetical protein
MFVRVCLVACAFFQKIEKRSMKMLTFCFGKRVFGFSFGDFTYIAILSNVVCIIK